MVSTTSFSVTEGIDSVWYDDNGASVGSFFSFGVPVTAFGLDITFTDAASSTVTIGGDVSDSIALVTDTPRFWGVIDFDGISSITFDASGSGWLGFDAVSYGNAVVPEPSSLLLLGMGVAGLGGYRLRRKRKTELTA